MDIMNIPKDKSYHILVAGQCDDCGGHGCKTCDDKGWLPLFHPKVRKCRNEECGKPIWPDHVAVYCSNDCAREDA